MFAFMRLTIPGLKQKLQSPKAKDRLVALHAMRRQIVAGRPRTYIDLAKALLLDRSENCRWQAAIVVGTFIEHHSERVWAVTEAYVRQGRPMAQDPVATVLVEHLLETDFPKYFTRLRRLASQNPAIVKDLLARCWAFGDAEKHWKEVESFLK